MKSNLWLLLFVSLFFSGCGDIEWFPDGNATSSATLSGTVSTLAGTAGTFGATDGTGPAASFTNPDGVTTDGTNLYVADTGNNTIRKIVIATGVVTTLAGDSSFGGAYADGTGTAALFSSPTGIATDGTNLYVADQDNHIIRKIVIATREVTTLAGTPESPGSADDFGTAASFRSLSGITATADGVSLYVADKGNNTIRKIVIATGEVSTIAGTAGTSGAMDATGSAARFNVITGITTDGTSLYVTDQYNFTIRKIVIATGAVTTLAGSAGNPGSADGTGAAASFDTPSGIITDGTNLYVADQANNTIRKIVIATGAVTTFAGTAGTSGLTDGIGSAALFNFPSGITTAGTNLYVVDQDNNTIRKIIK